MGMAPLIISHEVVENLGKLRELALQQPVNMQWLTGNIGKQKIKRAHMKQMSDQTVVIPGPFDFLVTFSIETHSLGDQTARHMSMSVQREGRVPHPAGVEMIANILGFTGTLADWTCWPETLQNRGTAVNVLQFISADIQQPAKPN